MKPIKTHTDYESALERVYALMQQDLADNAPELDELEILTILIEQYETEMCEIAPPHPIEAIKFRMEQLGMSTADVASMLGQSAPITEVLSGKQPLPAQMMKTLYHEMGVPAASLLAE